MLFGVSLVILILVLGLQIIRRFGGLFGSILRSRSGFTQTFKILEADGRGYQYILYGSVVLIFILLFYQSWQHYQIWSQNEVSRYLLPPHQSINYFIFYAFARFFAPYLISLAVAILFLFSAEALNKKYDERFFYQEELYFGALAIFLLSHPGWIFYAIAVILIYLLIHLFTLIYYKLRSITIEGSNQLKQKPVRISLYYVWLPVAIFVIIIQRWLEILSLWGLLKV